MANIHLEKQKNNLHFNEFSRNYAAYIKSRKKQINNNQKEFYKIRSTIWYMFPYEKRQNYSKQLKELVLKKIRKYCKFS